MVIRGLSATIFFASAALATASPRPGLEQADLIARVRQAYGVGQPGTWIVKGTGRISGVMQQFSLRADSSGKLRTTITGPLPGEFGYDGKGFWTSSWSGVPHYQQGGDAAADLLPFSIIGGSWLDAAYNKTSVVESSDDPVLAVTVNGGPFKAQVRLDGKTLLPKSLEYWNVSGPERWTFSGYKDFGGRKFPTEIEHFVEDDKRPFHVASVQKAGHDSGVFEIPKPKPDAVAFDDKVPADVELKVVGNHIFVQPKINGQEGGWFFFDTGADVMCLDSAFAKKIGAQVIGSQTTAGVVASQQLDIVRAGSFELGPVSYKNPTFITLDLAGIGKAVGLDVVGIIGYDLLARAVFDIDAAHSTLKVYRQGSQVPGESLEWESISFNGSVPAVFCRFEGGNKGWFDLDTGSGSTVDFCSPAVKRFKLMDNRNTATGRTGGAGGSAVSHSGEIEYFELAGHRFEKPVVGFQTAEKGVYASPYLDGNIGMGFLAKFRMVLDYANYRIGFQFLGQTSAEIR